MTLCQLILRSLRYYWRSGLAILAGIVVATAVITGSLLVGDSVNGSVRDTALARLGVIQQALLAPSFFRQGLADEIGKDVGAPASIVPLIIAQGTAQPANSQISVPNVNAIGIDANFWRCYPGTTVPAVNERAAAVNYALAHDLHLSTGDYLCKIQLDF